MKKDIRLKLTIGAGLVIVGLTAVAFWLSYAHLQEVADANGLDGARSWAWPATLDLFIIAGEILMLVAALKGERDGWAVALTVAGSVGSIGLNVYGVGAGAPRIEYIVAAVPPTAALLAFGALMRQIHKAVVKAEAAPEIDSHAHSLVVETPQEPVSEPASTQTLQEVIEDVEAQEDATQAADDVEEPEDVEVTNIHTASAKPSVQEISAAVEDIQASGGKVTGAALARYFGVSDRTGRRYRDDWQAAFSSAA